MCMKNINAIADIDALDEGKNIITQYNSNPVCKIIPVKNNEIKLMINFSASIINGKDNFFAKSEELSFQLRINSTDKEFNIRNFKIDLSSEDNYYNYQFTDFIYDNRNFIVNLILDEEDLDSVWFLSVLVKTKQDLREDKLWTVQSATPFRFVKD